MSKYSTVRYSQPPYNNIQNFIGEYKILSYGVELRFTSRSSTLIPWHRIVSIDTIVIEDYQKDTVLPYEKDER